jgi:hypothetical protein
MQKRSKGNATSEMKHSNFGAAVFCLSRLDGETGLATPAGVFPAEGIHLGNGFLRDLKCCFTSASEVPK